MLATQLFFAQFFAEKGNQEHLDRNLRALTWIHRHRDDIQRSLGSTVGDASTRAGGEGAVP